MFVELRWMYDATAADAVGREPEKYRLVCSAEEEDSSFLPSSTDAAAAVSDRRVMVMECAVMKVYLTHKEKLSSCVFSSRDAATKLKRMSVEED